MLKVLVAVDGSEHAKHAIEAVARLARQSDGLEAVLVNVRDVLGYYGDLPPMDYESVEARWNTAQTELLEAARHHAHSQGLNPVSTHAAQGNTVTEIIRIADELHVDQIALGTHGRGALGNLFTGSVAQRVVHLAKVPVLLVK